MLYCSRELLYIHVGLPLLVALCVWMMVRFAVEVRLTQRYTRSRRLLHAEAERIASNAWTMCDTESRGRIAVVSG